ncbi:MAG: hypothetical protein MUF22_01690 [Chitinispirillaceae bacterium]|jgi:hypothetical protein|nr:hypothetical protein [Chitinispirillaceae bacterium]
MRQIAVLFVIISMHSGAWGDGYSPACDTVVRMIDNARYDSAFYYLQKAYAAGLPDEKLYFYWARIYLERGIADTALALNAAAARTASAGMIPDILRQRYLIYASLGWTDRAQAILDSLKGPRKGSVSPVPRISLETSAGINRRDEIPAQPYPFRETPDVNDPLTNPDNALRCASSWFFPLGKIVLKAGLIYDYTSRIEQPDISYDSLNHSLGIALEAKKLPGTLTIGYSGERRLSAYKEWTTQHNFSVSRPDVSGRWLSFSSLLYSIELERGNSPSYQSVWLMHYAGRQLTPHLDLAVMPVFTLFSAKGLNDEFPASIMYIEDPDPAAGHVVHYTDSTGLVPIPVPANPDMLTQMVLLEMYKNAADKRDFGFSAPEDYFAFSPSVILTTKLPLGFSLESKVKGMANFYLEKHEWTAFSVPQSESYALYGDGTWLARAKDGRYYLVKELGNIVNAESYSGPIDVRHIIKRRIDLAYGGELNLRRPIGRIGTISLFGHVRKYWSTLQKDSPVKIRDFYGGFGMNFETAFGASSPDLQ